MITLLPLNKGIISQAAIVGVFLCLGTALINRYVWGGIRVKKYPAGPETWPIIGNLVLFTKILKDPEQELSSLAKRFGGICMLWLHSQPVLFVSKLVDAKELMDKQGAIFSDRPKNNIFFETVWPNLLPIKRLGEEFRLLRRVYNEVLGPKPSQAIKKYQDFESRIMLRDLYNDPEHFLAHTERYSMSVTFSAVYGVRVGRLDYPVMVELFEIWASMLRFFLPGSNIIDYLPFLERLPAFLQPWVHTANTIYTRETIVHNAFLRTLKKQIEAGTQPYCFGLEILKFQEKNDLDDRFTLDIFKGIILAGSETTSSMLQTIFKALALNPEAQKNAQEELDQVVGPLRLPTWEDSPNLPYLRALIKELHRWSPLLATGVPHASTQDFSYKGRLIPHGSMIVPNIHSLSRDSERYDDPDSFRPERFLGDDLDAFASAKQANFLNRDHVNYGWGRRLCQGIHVAENSIYMQVSRILWAFDIATRPGEPPLDLSEKDGGFIKKPKPYRLLIKPRSDAAIQVILQSAEEQKTDLPDADTVEM
ncbi:cytochrome P450 [Trichoderma ceciliae]